VCLQNGSGAIEGGRFREKRVTRNDEAAMHQQTLHSKRKPVKTQRLDDFVVCYNPKNRHERKESQRFKSFTYDELTKRDKLNLDIFWLKDESLEDSANLPDPDIIAAEIVEDLQAALAQFAEIANDLKR
jgi:type I restriction enzyme M protein